MVKLIFLCRRRVDIAHEQYVELLMRGHVPLALKHHPTLRRYVVNIVERSPASQPELDSIGELSFDSLGDFKERLYDSAVGQRIVSDDVTQFMGRADAYVTVEHLQKGRGRPEGIGERQSGVKMICPIRRRPDLSHAAFVDHWLDVHVPLALRHHPGLSKYVTNVVESRLSAEADELDGIAELHFPSREAFSEAMFDSPAGEATIRADMARFIDRTAAYIVGEYVERG